MSDSTGAIVITRLVKRGESGSSQHQPADSLVLDSDQRTSPHFSARTEKGRKLHISLDRGIELDDQDVLLADDGTAISVVAAAEDLLAVRPGEKALDWAAICYQLGNLHRPLRVAGDEILTPRDAQAEMFLNRLGADFSRARRPFIGRKLGAVASHHHHDHHGAHDHDDHHH